MVRAAIGIGSSLGNREELVQRAVNVLNQLEGTAVLSVSDLYETEPWGGVSENPYINACAIIETDLNCRQLLEEMQGIEKALGRTRKLRWGDRTCDLDLLDFNGMVLDEADLTLPHPQMDKRAFVMIPLMQIAPDMSHPVRKMTVAEMTRLMSGREWASVRRLGPCMAARSANF